MARGKKRGISVGTVVMLALTLCTLLVAGVVYLRISGEAGYIRLNADMLPEMAAVSDDLNVAANQDGAPTQTASTATAAPTQAPTPIPTARQPVTFVAAGQISMGSQLRESGQGESGAYAYGDIFTPVAPIFSGADASLVTLRTGLGDGEYGNYLAPTALARALADNGVTMANLATDRLLDGGVAGMTATVAALAGERMVGVGALRDPTLVEMNGMTLGLLAYTDAISSAGQSAASEEEIAAAVRRLNVQAAQADIASLREKGADVVIVLAYWGNRSDTKPSDATRQAADALARAGADAVLGVGPTSVHEFERKNVVSADGYVREVFIAYSLGNLLVDDSRETRDITGVLLELQFAWDEHSQRAKVTDARYTPTWIMRWSEAGGYRFQIVPAGMSQKPENMTDAVYKNMQNAYESMVKRLGQDVAQPRAQ